MFGMGEAAGGVVQGVIGGIGQIIDDVWTSDEEKIKAQTFMQKVLNAPFLASLKVLEKEASHPSVFVSGARPALLWATVFGIVYEAFFRGVLLWLQNWIIILADYQGPIPELPSIENVFAELVGLAIALYGVRGIEKAKGNARVGAIKDGGQ